MVKASGVKSQKATNQDAMEVIAYQNVQRSITKSKKHNINMRKAFGLEKK